TGQPTACRAGARVIDPAAASTNRTRIKICGIRTVEHALVAAEAGADAIGLMFVQRSPRYIGDFQRVREMLNELPPSATAVGVFQLTQLDDDEFKQWRECGTWCQFHGD